MLWKPKSDQHSEFIHSFLVSNFVRFLVVCQSRHENIHKIPIRILVKLAIYHYFYCFANSISMEASFSYFENTGNRSFGSNRNHNTAIATSFLFDCRINNEEFSNLELNYWKIIILHGNYSKKYWKLDASLLCRE